jgi:bifunctional non-homologous end joining protein LigD
VSLDLSELLSDELLERTESRDHPEWVDPMLATLTDDSFDDPDWIFERKLDGERCLAFRNGDDVRLQSRNRKSLVTSYPEITDAIGASLPEDAVVDGEVVAFDGSVTSFQRLQPRMQVDDASEARSSSVAVFYYVFDMLHTAGRSLEELPLRDRKRVLRQVVDWRDPLRFTPHRNREGRAAHERACRKGWEGVIAKDATSGYVHSRSRKWLKFKCVERQELVIGGFTEPGGQRPGLGALLLGYFEDDELRYAGKVGTGFDDDTLRDLRDRLDTLERETPPFDDGDLPTSSDVHWVRPELVAEIGFTEWTSAGRLRHPRFLGLRRDKDAEEVVRE